MTISDAAAARQLAYDRVVGELQKIDPKAIPIAKPDEAFAIGRVAQQAREAVPPAEPKASPERMLSSRVNNMWNAVAELVAKAKRTGIKVEFPPIKQSDDLGYQLQVLNEAHNRIEKSIEYFANTTPEQRMIETLRQRVKKLEERNKRADARIDAMASALSAVSDLLPHLLPTLDKTHG
jgi:hypothetical protein